MMARHFDTLVDRPIDVAAIREDRLLVVLELLVKDIHLLELLRLQPSLHQQLLFQLLEHFHLMFNHQEISMVN